MIKMEINEHVTSIEATGSLPNITAELVLAIKIFKDKFDANDMGDIFLDMLKSGIELIPLDDEDCEKALDDKLDELVDKALEDDMFLDRIMEKLPDELKTDFTKRLKKKVGERK